MNPSDALEQTIARTCELPAMPQVASRVLALMEDPKTSAMDLQRVISTDPGLTTRVLKIANSAFYSTGRSVETVSAAVVRMGFQTLRSLVVAACVQGLYRRVGLAEQKLWEHAVGVAATAHVLAQTLGMPRLEEAFTAGLLHDVGKSVLHQGDPDRYAQVMEQVYNEGAWAHEVEMEIYGFTHAQVGGVVIRRWRLPEALEQVVWGHHDPSRVDAAYRDMAALVHVADLVCLGMGVGIQTPRPVPLYDSGAAQALALTPQVVEAVRGALPMAMAQAMEAFA